MAAARRTLALGFALVACLASSRAAATDGGEGAVLLYADDDGVQVWTSNTKAHADAGPVELTARVGVDVISAASVDLVSTASEQGFEEIRREVEGAASLDLGEERLVQGAYAYSTEPDFVSHRVSLGHSRELVDRRLLVGLKGSWIGAKVGRADDPLFWRDRDTLDALLSGSWVLARDHAVDVDASLARTDGYQANPYRFVRLYEEGATAHATAVPESVPDERVRTTIGVRLRSHLGPDLWGAVGLEHFADTWGIEADSVSARLSRGFLDEALYLSAQARGYLQSGARFYEGRYETFPAVPVHRTAELRLGPLWSALGGLRLEWSPPSGPLHALRVGAGFELYHQRFLDSPRLDARTARLASLDLLLEL